MSKKNRNLRGLKSAGGNSGDEDSEYAPPMSAATSLSRPAPANDVDASEQNARKPRWSFVQAVGLGLAISALFWAAIAVIIHYI